MSPRETRELYITGNTLLDQILAKIASRLDTVEGLRADLETGYYKLQDGKIITTTLDPLEADEILGTTDQITVTENSNGTVTISIPDPLVIPGDATVTGDLGVTGETTLSGNLNFSGSARIAWSKKTANSVTITVGGTDATSVVANIQTAHDGNVFHLDEVAAAPAIDFYAEFINITAFNWVYILAQYSGIYTHDMTIQLYNWNTTSWNTFSGLPAMNYDTTPNPTFNNGSFFVPDDANYIGTGANDGKVRVRFVHFASGNGAHDLYVDAISLYQ